MNRRKRDSLVRDLPFGDRKRSRVPRDPLRGGQCRSGWEGRRPLGHGAARWSLADPSATPQDFSVFLNCARPQSFLSSALFLFDWLSVADTRAGWQTLVHSLCSGDFRFHDSPARAAHHSRSIDDLSRPFPGDCDGSAGPDTASPFVRHAFLDPRVSFTRRRNRFRVILALSRR